MARPLRRWHALPIHAALAFLAVLPSATAHAQVDCPARPGVLFAELDPVCFTQPATVIAAAYNVQPVIPDGYASVFLLTNGPDLVVRALAPYAQFIAPAPATYHLHTLVYDTLAFDPGSILVGTNTLFELNGLLIQGGGELCGALDLEGAHVRVQDCTDCTAKPGSLTAYKSKDCLTNSTWIGAVPNGDVSVPEGFHVAYLFTQGDDRVIIGRSAEPWYQVMSTGTYGIHTLVYDPTTLDLSGITAGVTTIADIDALLTQSGGPICGGLDLPGATIVVDDPEAGTLSMPAPKACLVDGEAVLTAAPSGEAHVPAGYEVRYVLSRGTAHVLVAIGSTPSFTVTEVDDYTIHTLVYDPSTLDLSDIVFGTTTAADVNGWLTQGGGHICGSLDVVGAEGKVDKCDGEDCQAKAGCMPMKFPIHCLSGGAAELVAGPDLGSVVPVGYVKRYVLTCGAELIIQAVADEPVFTVHQPGLYHIHTLVYDPATLDPSSIELGTTSAWAVNEQSQQGGGAVCAALDLRGGCFLVLGGWWCNWWNCHKDLPEGTLTRQVSDDRGLLKSVENDAPVVFNAWPNPVVDALTIEVTAYADATVQVDVLDLTGRTVATPLRVAAIEGLDRLVVPMDGLATGSYVVRVTAGDFISTVRIVKATN